MDEQLFKEGHKELIKLVQWVSTPMIYVPKGAIDDNTPRSLEKGDWIFGYEPVGKGMEVIHSLSKEDTNLVLKTFCESHLRLG